MSWSITVPKLNDNDETVLVTDLHVEDGARADVGDLLYSVETTKAIEEISAERAGYVRWQVAEGDRVPILTGIGFLCESPDEEIEAPAPKAAECRAEGPAVRATRAAKELAEQHGIRLEEIDARGIIREKDVLAVLNTRDATEGARGPEAETENVDPAFLDEIARDHAGFAALPSEQKVERYREHGARIGRNVTIGTGTVILARHIDIGDDTTLGDDVRVKCRRFVVGELGQIGDNCRFFCRDFIAGKVVTLRWNVAVVDGQGGIHDCRIGDLSFIAYDTYLNTDRDVTLDERVCLSPGVRLYTHRKWLSTLEGYPAAYAPVTIGAGCWLGPGSLVLPGVTLCAGCTLMPNSVAAGNAPPGALLGGTPATVTKARQQEDLSPTERFSRLVRIFEENTRALTAKGWRLEDPAADRSRAAWTANLVSDGDSARVVCLGEGGTAPEEDGEPRVLLVLGDAGGVDHDDVTTVFDLERNLVRGARNPASDIVRHLLYKYGVVLEPRTWRFGGRTAETEY